MKWKDIKLQADADTLLSIFGHFHDGCIRELHMWTEHWVNEDLSMEYSVDLDTKIRILVQRQFENPSAIELLFEEVERFNLMPMQKNYDSIIYGAILLVKEDAIYWSPEEDWSPESSDRDECTWIKAHRLKWREVNWLGQQLRYGPNEDDTEPALRP